MNKQPHTKTTDTAQEKASDSKPRPEQKMTPSAPKAAKATPAAKPRANATPAGKPNTPPAKTAAGKSAAANRKANAKPIIAKSVAPDKTASSVASQIQALAPADMRVGNMPTAMASEPQPVVASPDTITTTEAVPAAPSMVASQSIAAEPDTDVGISASLPHEPDDLKDLDDANAAPSSDFTPELSDEDVAAAAPDVDFDALRVKLTALQQQVRAAKIPVVILFEGWHAAGKGTLLSKLIDGLDPRGYQVYPIRKPTEEERAYPAMRRYCVNLPAQGDISLFCGSWYREVSNACFESKAARKRLNQTYDEIVSLESQLVSDGALLIKFFLHIPRKEQKARLKELESKKSTRWRVEKEDWEQNERYEEYLRVYDAMIARTHYDGALWHVLRSDNRRACTQQIYDTVIAAFEGALRDRAAAKREWDTPYLPHLENVTTVTMPQLDAFDPEQALTDPYKPAVDKAQKHLAKLQNELYRRGVPMAVCFEGWDAAGKGGAIRRLASALDARGYDVIPISAPTPLEKSHHHLWRFWNTLPKDGNIAIFDRTWYGRVMVERIEGFCTEPQWKRAYEEINRFEAEIVAHGAILVKFWLHIDPATQLTRFDDRESSPEKAWKITEEDWRNREKWPLYAVAVNEMLQKTNTAYAPWTVVEANNKQYARLKVLHTVIAAIEKRLEADQD